jgi:outer membrane receptor for ferrienterochelin and colicin
MFLKEIFTLFVLFVISTGQECQCSDKSNCRLWGDPHLESFYGVKKKIDVNDEKFMNIYNYENFNITATTFGKDFMDEITFGADYVWHKRDCKNSKTVLPIQTYIFTDGSYVVGTVLCSKSKNKKTVHLNFNLLKFIETEAFVTFKDHETKIKSGGLCTTTD